MKECRICLDEDVDDELISPCRCSGTSKWVHEACLQTWRLGNMNNDRSNKCEICHTEYMIKHIQPIETYFINFYTFHILIEIVSCFWFTMCGGLLVFLIDSCTDYQSLKLFNINESLNLREDIENKNWVAWAYYQGLCGFMLICVFFTYFYISIFMNVKQRFIYFKLVFLKNLLAFAFSFHFLYVLYFANLSESLITLSHWSPILTSLHLNIITGQIRFHNKNILIINNSNIRESVLSVQYNPMIAIPP
jgi:hypothetical protein